jgi:hypothetical protein
MRHLILTLALLALPLAGHAYSFTIENNTESKIVGIEVSEDGKSWGEFDIGGGIPAGSSVEAEWAEHTDDSNCEWEFRAIFADESVSEERTFDFCEEELTIEFE